MGSSRSIFAPGPLSQLILPCPRAVHPFGGVSLFRILCTHRRIEQPRFNNVQAQQRNREKGKIRMKQQSNSVEKVLLTSISQPHWGEKNNYASTNWRNLSVNYPSLHTVELTAPACPARPAPPGGAPTAPTLLSTIRRYHGFRVRAACTSGAARVSYSIASHGGGSTTRVDFLSPFFLELRAHSGWTRLFHQVNLPSKAPAGLISPPGSDSPRF